MPSEAATQPFKEFPIDPKANRQTRITCMVGLAFSAWHEQDIQKAQLYMALVGHYLREELPGHPLIAYNYIHNLHNTVLQLVYQADLYVPPAYVDRLWFLVECVVLSMLFTPESGITGLANPDTVIGLPLQLHLYAQSKPKYF